MINSTIPNKFVSILRSCAVLAFWLALWAIVAAFVDKKVLLPSPLDVLTAFAGLIKTARFWSAIAGSIGRILLGYAAGCIAGVLSAALCFRFRMADALLSPLLSIIRAVPVASFIILALVWIGRAHVPAFISFLMVLPIITGNMRAGLAHTDKELCEVARIYRFSGAQKIRYLYFPAALPHFISGAQTSLGLAWKAGVAAEVLCSLSNSIGGGIYEAKLYLETDSLFAWTIAVIIISMVIEKVLFHKYSRGRRRKELHT